MTAESLSSSSSSSSDEEHDDSGYAGMPVMDASEHEAMMAQQHQNEPFGGWSSLFMSLMLLFTCGRMFSDVSK